MNLNNKIGLLAIITLLSAAVISIMYVKSERQMHHENPFLRRYISGSVELVGQKMLHNATLYFAGTDGSRIYIGDYHAPLQIFVIDTLLKTEKQFTIKLENEKFQFKRVQVKIAGADFYVADGTVPVIFKGHTSDWKAKVLMQGNKYFFSNFEITAGGDIIFREYRPKQRETVIGKFTFDSPLKVTYASKLLQKQIDGLFDVDGILRYSAKARKFVYIYYYRNQFTVTDDALRLLYRGNTIDTNATANLKVSYDNDLGIRQLASPAYPVNKIAATGGNLMFVNSTVPGKFESKDMWGKARIVDVYNITDDTYLSSAYIYNASDFKLRDMQVVGSNLYALVGLQLQRYELRKHLKLKD